jgi:thiol-disulfide isomerase/thioredoxin
MLSKYYKYKYKYLTLKKNNLTLIGGSKKIKLFLFKANWCGHCSMFKPTWNTLKNDPQLKTKIDFITFDSEKNKNEIETYNIEGFPTIMLQKNDNMIQYEGQRNLDDLKTFISNYS